MSEDSSETEKRRDKHVVTLTSIFCVCFAAAVCFCVRECYHAPQPLPPPCTDTVLRSHDTTQLVCPANSRGVVQRECGELVLTCACIR